MLRLRPLVALAVIYLMVPGANETLENLVHLAIHGHGAHAVDDADHDFGESEHGCSGPYHLCACHSSLPFQAPSVDRGLRPVLAAQALAVDGGLFQFGDGYALALFRPPIG
jgi:hypothetical protein